MENVSFPPSRNKDKVMDAVSSFNILFDHL